jgi:uncharacterized membrane protein YfcA
MRIGLFLCVATTVGAVCGALLAVVLDQAVLSILFGAALLATVLLSLRKKPEQSGIDASDPLAVKLRLPGTMAGAHGSVPYTVHHVLPGFGVMWVAGVLSGLLGIGSGAFKVVAMDQIMRIPFKVTTATSNFMIGVTAAASVGVYLKRGYLDPALVAPVALGVLAGAFLGAKLLPVAPVKLLRAIFLTAVSVIAVQMIAALGVSLATDERMKHERKDDPSLSVELCRTDSIKVLPTTVLETVPDLLVDGCLFVKINGEVIL